MIDYFQKFKTLSDTLAAAGQPLNEFESLSFVLAGLGTDFDSIVTTISTHSDMIPLEDLYSHLFIHEQRIEHQSATTKPVFPFANVATKSPPQRGRGRGSSSFNRGRGHGRGHGSPPLLPTPQSDSSRPICQVCNKPSHIALTCYKWFNHAYQPEPPQQMQAYIATPSSAGDLNWYPDIGATHHITYDLNNLNLQQEEYTGQDQVHVGNGQGLPINHLGSSSLSFPHANFLLKNILHVPQIKKKKLLSVSKFTSDNNVNFKFHPSFYCVKDPMSGATLLKGQYNHGLYSLSPPQSSPTSPHAFMGIQTSLDGWHSRMGHPSLRLVHQVVSQSNLALLRTKPSIVCHVC